jgi:hypothetical protein
MSVTQCHEHWLCTNQRLWMCMTSCRRLCHRDNDWCRANVGDIASVILITRLNRVLCWEPTYFPSASSMSPRFDSAPRYRPAQLSGISSSAGYAFSWRDKAQSQPQSPERFTETLATAWRTYHVRIVSVIEHVLRFVPGNKTHGNILITV